MNYAPRNPLFAPRKALWRSSWLPLLIFLLLLCHATIGVRLADFVAQGAAKIGHRKKRTDGDKELVWRDLESKLWKLEQQNAELQSKLRALNRSTETNNLDFKRFVFVPGRIVLRDTAQWANFVWVQTNCVNDDLLFAPVVLGDIAIGIVDYVAKNRCRVRLLTNSQMSLSVTCRSDKDGLSKDSIGENDVKGPYLVGQVKGFGGAIWNNSGTLLLGEGYVPSPIKGNYAELARQFQGVKRQFAVGDHLVTSGLDGVFPPNLRVGQVDRVEPNRPGATRYEFGLIGALDLQELSEVLILKKGTVCQKQGPDDLESSSA